VEKKIPPGGAATPFAGKTTSGTLKISCEEARETIFLTLVIAQFDSVFAPFG
jgi:hypothetical protein